MIRLGLDFSKNRNSCFLFVCFSLAVLAAGCKKSANGLTPLKPQTPKYFLTATVNGVSFTATAVSGGTQDGVMLVLGTQISNSDTTGIVIGFPQTTSVNSKIPLNLLGSSLLAYGDSKNATDLYDSDPTRNGGGFYDITALDNTGSTVSGTFSGTVVDANGNTLKITDGTFTSQFSMNKPPSFPGLKF